MHLPALQGLAQGFEYRSIELREFIKEQDSFVRERNFAGAYGLASVTFHNRCNEEWRKHTVSKESFRN